MRRVDRSRVWFIRMVKALGIDSAQRLAFQHKLRAVVDQPANLNESWEFSIWKLQSGSDCFEFFQKLLVLARFFKTLLERHKHHSPPDSMIAAGDNGLVIGT